MTTAIIIALCTLLLVAYLFDLTASKTKIPSVILLLLLGWLVKRGTVLLSIQLPNFNPVLPVLGTIGLILIVLEGSLELELNKSKIGMIRKSFFGSLLSMVGLAFLLAYIFMHYQGSSLKDSLTNAIPFCIISSAIAIPSVRTLSKYSKDFVIYESSLSDILGVLFFNFVALNDTFDFSSFSHFGLQLIIVTIVSFVATIGLSFLLSRIEHHIKFIPIILLVILIYAVSKIYHLPGLIFIMLFGLFIGNLDELRHFKWIEKMRPDELNIEVKKFKELTIEAAFLVRALFFLLFGYLMETSEILNADTFVWALVIVGYVFVFRIIQLKLSKLPLKPLLFVAPRGLITILLFLSIEPINRIGLVNQSLIIQVIILSAFLMMIGIMTTQNSAKGESGKKSGNNILAD